MNTKEQAERIKDLIGTLCERRKQLNFDDCDGKIDLDVSIILSFAILHLSLKIPQLQLLLMSD